jgi:hypothetical protein
MSKEHTGNFPISFEETLCTEAWKLICSGKKMKTTPTLSITESLKGGQTEKGCKAKEMGRMNDE